MQSRSSLLLALALGYLSAMMNASPADEQCDGTILSVTSDATYCVEGNVCSGAINTGDNKSCPSEGDRAISDCVDNMKSYIEKGECIAPSDAVCTFLDEYGVYACVFPDEDTGKVNTSTMSFEAQSHSMSAAEIAIEIPMSASSDEQAPLPTSTPAPSTNPPTLDERSGRNSEDTATVDNGGEGGGANIGLNALVGVGAVVVAIIGVLVVKNRRHERKPPQMLSPSEGEHEQFRTPL